jgi:Cu-Zn family superoxide dismutase
MMLAPVALFTMIAAVTAGAATQTTRAVANLGATRGSSVSGRVTLARAEGGVNVTAEIQGLSQGAHGLHIHEFGDCSAPDGSSAGGHFNPTSEPHGGPIEERRHAGDLGNIVADKQGNARLEYLDGRFTLDAPAGVLGRAVVIHTNPDDLKTQPTGNSGARLACGVIGVVRSE